MIVVDASVLAAVLLDGADRGTTAAIRWLRDDPHWVVPEHAVIETVHAIRGGWLSGRISHEQLGAAVQTLLDWRLDVWPTAPLLPRVVELAHSATAYDASYLALAEELSIPLVTLDRRLASVPSTRCAVRVPGDEHE